MAEERFSFRWGIPWLDKGFVTVPNFFFETYVEVGVTRMEFLFILHLARYKFDSPQGRSRPSLPTIAKEMGLSVRRVQQLRASLEEKEWLVVKERAGRPSEYDFQSLAGVLLSRVPEHEESFTPEENFTPTPEANFTPPLKSTSPEEEEIRKRKPEEEISSPSKRHGAEKIALDLLIVNLYPKRMAKGMIGRYGAERCLEVMHKAIREGHLQEQGDWVRKELARGQAHDQPEATGKSRKQQNPLSHEIDADLGVDEGSRSSAVDPVDKSD